MFSKCSILKHAKIAPPKKKHHQYETFHSDQNCILLSLKSYVILKDTDSEIFSKRYALLYC